MTATYQVLTATQAGALGFSNTEFSYSATATSTGTIYGAGGNSSYFNAITSGEIILTAGSGATLAAAVAASAFKPHAVTTEGGGASPASTCSGATPFPANAPNVSGSVQGTAFLTGDGFAPVSASQAQLNSLSTPTENAVAVYSCQISYTTAWNASSAYSGSNSGGGLYGTVAAVGVAGVCEIASAVQETLVDYTAEISIGAPVVYIVEYQPPVATPPSYPSTVTIGASVGFSAIGFETQPLNVNPNPPVVALPCVPCCQMCGMVF